MFRILIPVDFSEGAAKACHYALQLAAGIPEAKLLLLHCFQDYLADADPMPVNSAGLSPSEKLADRVLHRNEIEAEEKLEALYLDLKTQADSLGGNLHVARSLLHGLPEEEILEEIERFRPTVVVMSTKGESSIGRAVFGTVSTKVIEESDVPVLTIPSHYKGDAINRVLYATDFGRTDVADIDQLRKLFQHLQPLIYCVHISDDLDEKREKLLELQLNLQHGAPDNDIRYALLEGRDVAEALQNFAETEGIDLLALTTRERSTLDSLFSPSLAKKMVLHAPMPILVFHSKA